MWSLPSSRILATSMIVLSLLTGNLAVVGDGEPDNVRWGIIGNTERRLTEEVRAGIGVKVVRVSWRSYMPDVETTDFTYVESKRTELRELRDAGFEVVVDAGLQDTPTWLHDVYDDSYYVNQFGDVYEGEDAIDMGDANLVFNHDIRDAASDYLARLFADLGTDFYGFRLGGGRYGELTYPPASYRGVENNYWAFDANARESSPVSEWVPGSPAPNGEARAFLNWYLDALTSYQDWQIDTVRQHYDGSIMMLYPSWGIRPGQVEEAIEVQLNGSTSAEINGEIQRGMDFQRQVMSITDSNVIVTTTWLDADGSQDDKGDPRYWSPVKYLSYLADMHPLELKVYGENSGWDGVEAMEHTVAQMLRYELIGMAWFREDQLFSGLYATLGDYARIIARHDMGQGAPFVYSSAYMMTTPKLRPSNRNTASPLRSIHSRTSSASGYGA